jgi:hypothetical protein
MGNCQSFKNNSGQLPNGCTAGYATVALIHSAVEMGKVLPGPGSGPKMTGPAHVYSAEMEPVPLVKNPDRFHL